LDTWKINIVAPTGAFDATLNLIGTPDKPTGEMAGKNGKGPMLDLKIDATHISWSTKVERPMPMKLKFQGAIEGNVLSGTVKFGLFASGTFSGTRE
jgi:hypothetical protein